MPKVNTFPLNKDVQTYKSHMDDAPSIFLLTDYLSQYFTQSPKKRPISVVCIGTDRSTGDSLGPLVGTELQQYANDNFHIFGTLEHPVHATNLQHTLEELNFNSPNSFIVAVDACLGRLDSVGFICLAKGALHPGAGVHKNLPHVGEAHLTGIVNVGGFMEYMVLQNTRLHLVMKMAKIIAQVIYSAYSCIDQQLLRNGK